MKYITIGVRLAAGYWIFCLVRTSAIAKAVAEIGVSVAEVSALSRTCNRISGMCGTDGFNSPDLSGARS